MAEQRGSSAITTLTSKDDAVVEQVVKRLRALGVVILNPEDIVAYFEIHSGLAEIVVSLCENARSQFPLPTELALSICRDREVDDEYLTLNIRPPEYREGLVQQIEDFTSRQDKLLADHGSHVLVTTDFRLPGEFDAVRMD